VIRGVIVAGILVLIASAVDKTLWDWLELLIVPVVLAIGGYLFTRSENRATRVAAEQRSQDEALQTYLDQMGQMLLDKAQHLRRSQEGGEERTLARARTLTVLPRLDGERKRSVLQFLYESGLIAVDHPVVNLSGADLSEAKLKRANLRKADLSKADLRGADLSRADLGEANLGGANLGGANLGGANLHEAHLHQANLADAYSPNAYLKRTDLGYADLSGADLAKADVSESYLFHAVLFKAVLRSADFEEANLVSADLREVDLSDADLSDANLWHANLSGADLAKADLWHANLTDARGVTYEQLAQALSLAGATMPDGQILKRNDNPDGPTFEEWLKSKGRGEDRENSGPS
jgi:uncharacterized protein YjbI with pentapeptide repeats